MPPQVVNVDFVPPLETGPWGIVHWSDIPKDKPPEEVLKPYGLHPDIIYRDAGGSLWIPSHKEKLTVPEEREETCSEKSQQDPSLPVP